MQWLPVVRSDALTTTTTLHAAGLPFHLQQDVLARMDPRARHSLFSASHAMARLVMQRTEAQKLLLMVAGKKARGLWGATAPSSSSAPPAAATKESHTDAGAVILRLLDAWRPPRLELVLRSPPAHERMPSPTPPLLVALQPHVWALTLQVGAVGGAGHRLRR